MKSLNGQRNFAGNKWRRKRGVATVEFALILPILLALVLGIIEFGFLVMGRLTVANAAREAVRFAALGNTSVAVRTRVKVTAKVLNPPLTDAQIVLDQTSDKVAANPSYTAWPADANGKNGVLVGNLLRVTVLYRIQPLTGFFPFLNNRDYSVVTSMARETA